MAQTTYQVNGRTIYKNNGQYYDLVNNDSILIDSKHISIEFLQSKEVQGMQTIVNQYGGKIGKKTMINDYVYTIDSAQDYLTVLNSLSIDPSIDKLTLSYIWHINSMQLPNDPYYPTNNPYTEHDYMDNMQMANAWSLAQGSPNKNWNLRYGMRLEYK